MFENLRARLIKPKKANTQNVYNVFSRRSPGVAVYTDLSITRATRDGYKMSIYVYRAIRTIVQAASGIPWIVLDKNGEAIPDHDFTKTWARPNPQFSGQDNMEYIIAHLKLVGNSIIQPLMVNGRPKEFWVCMPDLIHPIPSKTPGVWLDGYEVSETEGKTHTVPVETFIHLMQFNPGDPYWGIGDLQAAARTVDTDNEAIDTQKVSMQNRGTPDGVFVNEAISNQDEFEEAKRQVKANYLTKEDRRMPWVIGGNTKWYQMSLTPVEMDYIQSRLRNLQDIAAAFGLDPWWLGDRTNSTYNNVNEAKKALYETAAIPLLDDIKSTLNLKVAPLYGEGITITYDVSNVAALREDFGQKVTQARSLWDMGIPFEQINDKLKMGFEEFDGWDTGYLPFSLAPAGQASEPAPEDETPAPGKSIKAATQTEEQKTAAWKRIDSRRAAWINVVQKKVAPLYEAERKAIASAIEGWDPSEMYQHAAKAIEGKRSDWEKVLTAIDSTVIEDFGNQVTDQFKSKKTTAPPKPPIPPVFDPFSDAVKEWLRLHVAEGVTSILETNMASVKRIITKGVEDLLSNKQIADQLMQYYDDNKLFKSMRVARTETTMAASKGQMAAAEQLGFIKKKKWLSTRDDRTRESHSAIDGEEVELDDVFSNGCEAPGIGSDPAETIQCRCVLQFLWD